MPRLWLAAGLDSGLGLPVDSTGTCEQTLVEYGPEVVSRKPY